MGIPATKPYKPNGRGVAKVPLSKLTESIKTEIAQDVLDRYINGEQVAKIAPKYGVSDVTIYALLLREHSDAWRDIQTARALSRLERNQDALLDDSRCSDMLSFVRIKEGIRSAQWELERLLRRFYGQEAAQVAPSLTVVIRRMGAEDVELEVGTGRVVQTIDNPE